MMKGMGQSREFSELPTGQVKFSFGVGQYLGPVSDPTYRQEVVDHGLEDVVDNLLKGIVPERFSWMQPVVDDQIATGKQNKPLRFMSVISELRRAQSETVRDLEYEQQVVALGSLLYDSCDENFNYLGFFITIQTKDEKLHTHEWGSLKLNPDDNTWYVLDDFPISDIEAVMPTRPSVTA